MARVCLFGDQAKIVIAYLGNFLFRFYLSLKKIQKVSAVIEWLQGYTTDQ